MGRFNRWNRVFAGVIQELCERVNIAGGDGLTVESADLAGHAAVEIHNLAVDEA